MKNVLIINEEWAEYFENVGNKYLVVKYTPNTFSNTVREVILSPEGYTSLMVVTDYHPRLPDILINGQAVDSSSLIKVEPAPFTHPFCHFSGLFFFSILWLLNYPEVICTHSYMISIPAKLLTTPEITHILNEVQTPYAFNLGMVALAIKKNVPTKPVRILPHRSSDAFYEILKTEFIHSSATLMKVLEIPDTPYDVKNDIHPIPLSRDEKIEVPGYFFLSKEFTTGFRRYAPFWKEHLFEDHFALLSAIYSGKENAVIDDRIWIRIMFEFINVSLKFEDKTKIARRIFPIYALYLKTVHQTPISERFRNYLGILEEESKFLKD